MLDNVKKMSSGQLTNVYTTTLLAYNPCYIRSSEHLTELNVTNTNRAKCTKGILNMFTLFMLKLGMGAVAFALFFLFQFVLLRFFDKLLDINFKKAFDKIEQCPKAMSHYYGLRFLGTSIAIGLIVCVAFIV